MNIKKHMELKTIIAANLEVTDRVTRPSAAGVKAISEFLGCISFDDYLDVDADIMTAIDAAEGTRPSINSKVAKSLFS